MKKLFKFEFFSVCRVLVPIWCGTLLLSLLIGGLGILSAQLPALGESLPYLIIYTFAAILFIFAAMASIIASVVLGIQRFYKLLGNQGYLMFSLPMPAWKHIGARLLCACLTTTLAVAVFVVCGAVLSFSSIQAGALVTAENFQFLAFDDLADLLWSGYALLIWLLCLATIYLFLYLCMAGGQHLHLFHPDLCAAGPYDDSGHLCCRGRLFHSAKRRCRPDQRRLDFRADRRRTRAARQAADRPCRFVKHLVQREIQRKQQVFLSERARQEGA